MDVFHCHILEHHAAGMMANFDVIDDSRPNEGLDSNEHHHHH
jgi:hypothetical protein